MGDATLPPELLETLARFDTPTICNALEIVAPLRRTTGFTTRTFVCADPLLAPMAGYARRATIRALEAPSLSPEEQRRRRLDYYAYVAQGPQPTVVLAPGFQLLGGKLGPSHAYVHVVDFAVEVNVFGMTVPHNDLVHADRHGVVVIPRGVALEIQKAVDLCTRREAVILETARGRDFDIERLRVAMEHTDEIH